MKIKVCFLCFIILLLTACTHTINKENEKEAKESTEKIIKIFTTTENNSIPPSETIESEETTSSKNNETVSDTDVKLNFTKDSKTSSLTFTLGMSYDDVEHSLASIGENINKTPWDAYSDYTIIDKKEIWSKLKTTEDYNKYASIEVFLTNYDMKYSFFFISNKNSNILYSIHCDNSNIETNKHIRCGDDLNNLVDKYGNDYCQFNTDKYIIYEYKTNNGYLDFYIDPHSHLISEWGIDLYSYQVYSESSKILDRIYSDESNITETPLQLPQNSQTSDEYKEDDTSEESVSNSSVITQEKALNIVKDELKPVFNKGDYVVFDHRQTKKGNDYYVFRYYYEMGTLAWFYVNETDGSCYVLDCNAGKDDLIKYHSGDSYWSH